MFLLRNHLSYLGSVWEQVKVFFFFLHNAWFEGLLLQKLYFIKRVCVFM